MDPYDILNAPSTQQKTGLTHAQHLSRLISFGSNFIDTRKSPPLATIVAEIRKPIYLFQLLVFSFWIAKTYYIYAVLNLLFVIVSFIANVLGKNDSKKIIKQLIKTYGPEVRVTRDGQSFMAGSASLVPGDVIQITGRITLPCDLVLIEGIMDVDESTITGDTVPAQKVPYKGGETDIRRSSAMFIQQENTLIGGTRILSVKYALAVVIRTGFNTSRGRTIRTLLSQKQDTRHGYTNGLNQFIFTFMFASFLNLLAAVLYKYFFLEQKADSPINYVDLFVCTVPPFMPLVLILPLYIAKRRLKKSRVKCTSLLGLMKMGTVNCVCYDKTGTMTEESLLLYGTIETKKNQFLAMRESPLDMSRHAISVMAACHNLVRVNDRVMGDHLEEALFKRCGYELSREKTENRFLVHPPPAFNDRGTIQVTHVYPFSSTLRRMSVVTKIPNCCVYTKGSPNSIKEICSESTIPVDYDQIVANYGLLGYRIIAMAKRSLRDDEYFLNLDRKDVEKNMEFLGFLVLKSQLYPTMKTEIKNLKSSNIKCKVVTGDTVFTAISAAMESGMIQKNSRVLMAEAVKGMLYQKTMLTI